MVMILPSSFSKASGKCVSQVSSCQIAPEDKCLLQLLPLSSARVADHWWFGGGGPKLHNVVLVKTASLHGTLSDSGKKSYLFFSITEWNLLSSGWCSKSTRNMFWFKRDFTHKCCSSRKAEFTGFLPCVSMCQDLPCPAIIWKEPTEGRWLHVFLPLTKAIGRVGFLDLKSVSLDDYLVLPVCSRHTVAHQDGCFPYCPLHFDTAQP